MKSDMQSFAKYSVLLLLPLWLNSFILLCESRGIAVQDDKNYVIKFTRNAKDSKEEYSETRSLDFPYHRVTHEVITEDGLYFHLPVNCSMLNDAIAFDTYRFIEVSWLKLSKDGLIVHGFLDIAETEPTRTICIGNISSVCACIIMHCNGCATQNAAQLISISGTERKAEVVDKSADLRATENAAESSEEGTTKKFAGSFMKNEGSSGTKSKSNIVSISGTDGATKVASNSFNPSVAEQETKSTKEGSTRSSEGTILRNEEGSALKKAKKNVMESATRATRHRPRRDVADLQYQISCGGSSKVTEGVILLNANYHNMSLQEKAQIVSQASAYTGVAKRNIILKDNHGNFYKTELSNPSFIAFGLGDSTGQIEETTIVKFLLGCDSVPSTDSRIAKIRDDSPTGALTGLFGHKIIGWYIIAGIIVPITTTAPPR